MQLFTGKLHVALPRKHLKHTACKTIRWTCSGDFIKEAALSLSSFTCAVCHTALLYLLNQAAA